MVCLFSGCQTPPHQHVTITRPMFGIDSIISTKTDTLSMEDTTVVYELPPGWQNDWETVR